MKHIFIMMSSCRQYKKMASSGYRKSLTPSDLHQCLLQDCCVHSQFTNLNRLGLSRLSVVLTRLNKTFNQLPRKNSSHMAREVWSSRLAFIFAAVGAAVGFGNIWRFPALAYDYGGGAFFIPYLLALFLIGIPLLVLEISMGQYHRVGDVGVFGSIHKRLGGVGLSSVMCGFFVTAYYVPLLSWVIRAFVQSFHGRMSFDWEDITGTEASEYFFNEIIGMDTLGDDMRPTRIVIANVFYLLLSWLCIGLCLAFGIKWTGRIAYVTMGLPILLLVVFFIRAVTLPGASTGIDAYIGEWDLSVLKDRPDCWSTAVSQIFFSLGVTFGVMTAFGSHCPLDAPAFENSVIIALSNSFFSFVSGFAVFGVLGYLKQYEDADHIDEVVKSGPALLFGAYPAALSTVPGGLHWVRFLFFNLFLLGIDSAFALTEAVLTVLKDSTIGSTIPQKNLVAGTIAVGFLSGLMYTTDAGLILLDVIDFYINFIMLFIGFFKSFSAGWIFGIENQIKTFGSSVVYGYMLTTFGAIVIASCIWFGFEGDTALIGILAFFLWYGIGMANCVHMLKTTENNQTNSSWSWKSSLYDLLFGNVFELKSQLESSVGKIPFVWAILMKHVIPPTLLLLFINLACAKTDEQKPVFGNYGGYTAWPFQILGVSVVLLVVLVVSLGVLKPELFDTFMTRPKQEQEIELEEANAEKDVSEKMDYKELPANVKTSVLS